MAVEKSIAQLMATPEPAEVEVEAVIDEEAPVFASDDTVMLEDGSAIVGYVEEEKDFEGDFYSNLAEEMEEGELDELASELLASYKDDLESRQDWLDQYTDGLDLLGIKTDDREEPFRGATGVYHPLIAESATQFQAGAYKELLPPGGPTQTRIIGNETPEVVEQAERVRSYMNFIVLDVMEEFDPELDQMLFYLPLAGSTFKKTYFDQTLNRPVSKFVMPDDLVVSYTESSLETTPRFTHVINMSLNDVRKLQVSDFYRDIELFPDEAADLDDAKDKVQDLTGFRRNVQSSDSITLLEMHVDLDLPGFEEKDEDGVETGIAIPYIVTIHEETSEILSIRRNFEENDPKRSKIRYFTHYKFLPGLGFYGFGLIHMIGGLTKSATSILRQLIDAGTLANLPAGFKARGLRVRDEDLPLQPGEFRDVDAPGSSIREAIMPLPYKEPSGTLLQMLGVLVDSGRRFASVTDMNIGEGSQANPVGTTVALLEQGTKVLSAIHKRLHYAQRQELRILANVIKNYLPPEYPYQTSGDVGPSAKTDDFDDRIDIVPVSDPAMFSMSQRVTLAQTQLQLAQSAPQLHDLHEAYRRMYLALNIQNVDKILPPRDEAVPKDPVSENMDALMGKALKAFESQNHDAHVATHSAFLQDPNVQKNAMAMQSLMAHMQEHLALKYRQQVEQILGFPLPAEGQVLPPEQEAMLAQATAQATAQISQMAQQIAGTGQFDPIVQLKQQELQIQQQEVQRKAMADQARNQLDAAKLQQDGELKKAEISSDEDIAALRANVTLATKR
jgi:hypothetical protein|tara:strand:- start:7415 stop:9775 length:2361 start_codon:yes stop_codon:yes gene_type:complete